MICSLPVLNCIEGLLTSNIIHKDKSHCSSIVGSGNGPVSFLPSSVLNKTYRNNQALSFYIHTGTGIVPSISALEPFQMLHFSYAGCNILVGKGLFPVMRYLFIRINNKKCFLFLPLVLGEIMEVLYISYTSFFSPKEISKCSDCSPNCPEFEVCPI